MNSAERKRNKGTKSVVRRLSVNTANNTVSGSSSSTSRHETPPPHRGEHVVIRRKARGGSFRRMSIDHIKGGRKTHGSDTVVRRQEPEEGRLLSGVGRKSVDTASTFGSVASYVMDAFDDAALTVVSNRDMSLHSSSSSGYDGGCIGLKWSVTKSSSSSTRGRH